MLTTSIPRLRFCFDLLQLLLNAIAIQYLNIVAVLLINLYHHAEVSFNSGSPAGAGRGDHSKASGTYSRTGSYHHETKGQVGKPGN